jgi:hypothetical protein
MQSEPNHPIPAASLTICLKQGSAVQQNNRYENTHFVLFSKLNLDERLVNATHRPSLP